MTVNLAWINGDQAEVVAALAGFTVCPIASQAEPFTPPAFTSDPANPAVFVSWELAYTGADYSFEPDDAPIRSGRLQLAAWVEPCPSAPGRALDLLGSLLAVLLDATTWQNLTLLDALPQPGSMQANGWWAAGAVIDFKGA